MLETLWVMPKLLFFFGFLPAGILLLIYLFLEKHLNITDSVITLIKNSKTELINIGAAFVWLCFFGFVIWMIIKLA
jgi:hypothetical protein